MSNLNITINQLYMSEFDFVYTLMIYQIYKYRTVGKQEN